jgi:hypothetical protein
MTRTTHLGQTWTFIAFSIHSFIRHGSSASTRKQWIHAMMDPFLFLTPRILPDQSKRFAGDASQSKKQCLVWTPAGRQPEWVAASSWPPAASKQASKQARNPPHEITNRTAIFHGCSLFVVRCSITDDGWKALRYHKQQVSSLLLVACPHCYRWMIDLYA